MTDVNSVDEQQWYLMHALLLKRRKTLKTKIPVSSQAICIQTMRHLAHSKRKTEMHSKNKSKTIILLPAKKGGKRRWTKQQNHQFNKMQKHQLKSSYTNYTQPIKSASHDQKWANIANQQASDAARDQSKDRQPSQSLTLHIIRSQRRKGRERERQRDVNEDAGGASPHEKHRNTHMMRTVNNPSKCARSKDNKMHTLPNHIWPFAYFALLNLTWATMKKEMNVWEWVRKSLQTRQRGWRMQYHYQKSKENKTNSTHCCVTQQTSEH